MNRNPEQVKSDREDGKWIIKARRGNKQAFERLVVKHQKAIYFTIRKLVTDHDAANDLVQDTFVKAWTGVSGFDEKHVFYPWLHRIAINTAINFLNKKKRQAEDHVIDDDSIFELAANGSENPDAQFEQKDLKLHLKTQLDKLPEEMRLVFVLRVSEGLSYQEISDELEISIGTVMSRLARAREKLRLGLKPFLSD